MSDNLSRREHAKVLQISCNSSLLQYLFEQQVASPCLQVKLPNKVLLKWRELKKTIVNISYLKLFHLSAANLPFQIKPETETIEENIRTLASKVYAQGRGLSGLMRINFLKKEQFLMFTNKSF